MNSLTRQSRAKGSKQAVLCSGVLPLSVSSRAARHQPKAINNEGNQGAAPDSDEQWNTSLSQLSLRIAQLQAKELTTGYKAENLQAVVDSSAEQRPELQRDTLPSYTHYEKLAEWWVVICIKSKNTDSIVLMPLFCQCC